MRKPIRAAGKAARKERKKRRALRSLLFALIFLLALALGAFAAVGLYAKYTRTHYEITFFQESSNKVSRNIRLAVLADVHGREYGEGNETLVSDLRMLKPDVILFAGDMVVRERTDYQAMLDLVSRLSEVAPCYGVLGNHESERIYYHDDRDLPAKFEQAGLRLLRNAMEAVPIGEDVLQIVGVEGTSYGFEEYGGRRFMEENSLDPSAYTVVMAHIPILFDPQLSSYDFDLGIAGHVHGGIVRLPFLGGLYSDEEGFLPDYDGGAYTLSGRQTLIVSRGLGDSSAFPPRINNMPELVIVDINWY